MKLPQPLCYRNICGVLVDFQFIISKAPTGSREGAFSVARPADLGHFPLWQLTYSQFFEVNLQTEIKNLLKNQGN